MIKKLPRAQIDIYAKTHTEMGKYMKVANTTTKYQFLQATKSTKHEMMLQRKGSLYTFLVEMSIGIAIAENSMEVHPKKLKLVLSHDS